VSEHSGGDLTVASESIVTRPSFVQSLQPTESSLFSTLGAPAGTNASPAAAESLLGRSGLSPTAGGGLVPEPPSIADEQQALLELADEQEKLAKRSAELQEREVELERFVGLEASPSSLSWNGTETTKSASRQMHSWWEPFMSGAGPLPGLASALVVPVRFLAAHLTRVLDAIGNVVDRLVEPIARKLASGLHAALCAIGLPCSPSEGANPDRSHSALGCLAWALVGISAAYLLSGDSVKAAFSGLVMGLAAAIGASLFVMAGVPADFVRSSGAYMLLTIATACIYKTIFILGGEPSFDLQNDSYWAFDLIDHRTFTTDHRVCLAAILCPAARWAHTFTSSRIAPFVPFWPVVFIFAILGNISVSGVMEAAKINWCVFIAAFISCIYWALLVSGRQRIRKVYDMPAGGWTIAEDALTWLLCFPCAMTQEAHQVERVDPDPPPPEEPMPDEEIIVAERPCIGGWFAKTFARPASCTTAPQDEAAVEP